MKKIKEKLEDKVFKIVEQIHNSEYINGYDNKLIKVIQQDLLDTIKKKLEELISSKSSDYNKGVQDSINLISSFQK